MDPLIIPAAVLRAQHGKSVDIKLGNGGPIIGSGVLVYNEDTSNLGVSMRIDQSKMGDFLKGEYTRIVQGE